MYHHSTSNLSYYPNRKHPSFSTTTTLLIDGLKIAAQQQQEEEWLYCWMITLKPCLFFQRPSEQGYQCLKIVSAIRRSCYCDDKWLQVYNSINRFASVDSFKDGSDNINSSISMLKIVTRVLVIIVKNRFALFRQLFTSQILRQNFLNLISKSIFLIKRQF